MRSSSGEKKTSSFKSQNAPWGDAGSILREHPEWNQGVPFSTWQIGSRLVDKRGVSGGAHTAHPCFPMLNPGPQLRCTSGLKPRKDVQMEVKVQHGRRSTGWKSNGTPRLALERLFCFLGAFRFESRIAPWGQGGP